MKQMKEWSLRLGRFLFKHRSFTPLPIMILLVVFFKPIDAGAQNIIIHILGLFIALSGEFIRMLTVGFSHSGSSGRESHLRADRLNTTGLYSLVRNPLYIGNFFIFSGLIIVFANPLALLVMALFLSGQYYFIILAEEAYLKDKYGPEFDDYCARVRRIIPGLMAYRKNSRPFNAQKVLFKENDSLFNLLMIFLLLLLYKEKLYTGYIARPLAYIVPAALLILAYIIVKILKKRVLPRHPNL